jgi:FkbM family methyltransferase
MLTERERVVLTTSCRDTDALPKVVGAGQILETADGRVQVMHNGVLIAEGCYYGDWMTTIIRDLAGHHEPQEEIAIDLIVERIAGDTGAPTMVELGAFWAYYSLWMMHRVPATRAILVEPDPNNMEAGRRNLALNGRHAEAIQAAVGAEPRPPEPFDCESDGVSRLVPTESLTSLVERFGLDRIDVLLVDVQGAETALLEGARHTLADRVRFLVVSTHHHDISGDPLTHQRCLDLIRGLGGHIIAEHTVAESFSGDGLIAASFDPRDVDLRADISYARATESLFGDPLVDLAAARAERDQARDDLAAGQAELNAMRATLTWQLHQRLDRSRAGRGVLRIGSTVGRRLRSPK